MSFTVLVSILFCTYCRRAIHWYSSDSIRWDKIAQWFLALRLKRCKIVGIRCGIPSSRYLQLSTGTSMGTCGNALSSYVCILCLKKLYKQVQKNILWKNGGKSRVGRSMCTETTQSSQTRLWAGVVSCMLQLVGGGGSIFAIFTSWVQHYFQFWWAGLICKDTLHALWRKEKVWTTTNSSELL